MNGMRFFFKISQSSLSMIIPETLNAIVCVLFKKHVIFPKTHLEWLKIAKDFEDIWGFPHVLGAVDGKVLINF